MMDDDDERSMESVDDSGFIHASYIACFSDMKSLAY
jgi:hypothetical protein